MSNELNEELAQQVSSAVENTSEYHEFLDALDAVESNDDAQELLTRSREIENKLEVAMTKGEEHENQEKLEEEFENIQEELNGLDVMQAYHDTASELSQTLEEFNLLVSENIDINFAHFAIGEN